MKKKLFMGFMLVLLLVARAKGETEYEDFEQWNVGNDETTKFFHAVGVISGITQTKTVALGLSPFPFTNLGDNLKMPHANNGEIYTEMNKIYSEPANRKMLVIQVYWLAATKLRDDDSNDYQHLEKVFRSGNFLPRAGTVVKVIDGDTIVVAPQDDSAGEFTVRLMGINAPELINEDGSSNLDGEKARKYLQQLISKKSETGQAVRLAYGKDLFDKYGRVLAYVFSTSASGPMNYNVQMLKDGFAVPYFYRDPKRPTDYKEDGENIFELAYKDRKNK